MKYQQKMNLDYDLKETNMKKRNAVNKRRKSTSRGILKKIITGRNRAAKGRLIKDEELIRKREVGRTKITVIPR